MNDGETVTNEHGGRQSFTLADYSKVPPQALRLLAQCLGFGARKYGADNWKRITIEEHLSHATNHIVEFRCGDRSEPHLVNTFTRVAMALQLAVEQGLQADRYEHPDMKAKVRLVESGTTGTLSDLAGSLAAANLVDPVVSYQVESMGFDSEGFYSKGLDDADSRAKSE
jgi:hypothetical protein